MSIVQMEKDANREVAAPDADAAWFQKYGGQAADAIRSFCMTHDLAAHLKDAVRLAETCFAPSAIRLEEDVDPETDDRKIVIAVTTHNKSRQEVLAAYRAYVRESVKLFRWPKSGLVLLSYDIS
jgi:hypothetical protein